MRKAAFLLAGLVIINPLVYPFPRVELYSIGGLQFSNLSVSFPDLTPAPGYSPRLGYGLGAGFHFAFSRRFSIETDVLYKARKSELTKFSGVEWNDTYYHLKCLAVPLLAHLQFSSRKIQIFVIVGAEGSWIFRSRIEDKKDDVIIKPIPGLKSYDLQAIVGAGIRHKRMSVEFRYLPGLVNLSKDTERGLSIRSQGFELLVAFRLA